MQSAIEKFYRELRIELEYHKHNYKENADALSYVMQLEKIVNDDDRTILAKWNDISALAAKMPGYFSFWSPLRHLTLAIQSVLKINSKDSLAEETEKMLRNKVLLIDTELKELHSKISSLSNENIHLKQTQEQVTTTNMLTSRNVDLLIMEKNELVLKVKKLSAENQALIEENASLSKMLNDTNTRLVESQVLIQQLSDKVNVLTAENEETNQRLNVLAKHVNEKMSEFDKFVKDHGNEAATATKKTESVDKSTSLASTNTYDSDQTVTKASLPKLAASNRHSIESAKNTESTDKPFVASNTYCLDRTLLTGSITLSSPIMTACNQAYIRSPKNKAASNLMTHSLWRNSNFSNLNPCREAPGEYKDSHDVLPDWRTRDYYKNP